MVVEFMRGNRKYFNPFIITSAVFLLLLVVYQLYWSGLYPLLSPAVILFFFAFSAFGLVFHFRFANRIAETVNVSAKLVLLGREKLPGWMGISFIGVIFIVEVLYNGGVPIVKMIQGIKVDYRDFSFPGVHIFFVTYSGYYAVKSFVSYFLLGKKWCLISFFLIFLMFAALMHRSMLVFLVFNVLLVIGFLRGYNFKKFAYAILLLFAVFYTFGLAGDIRTNAQIGEKNAFDTAVLMRATSAADVLVDNTFFHPMYWSYLYFSSPLANFQNTVDNVAPQFSMDNTSRLVLYEFVPDFVLNRITDLIVVDLERSGLIKVIDFLTVGTIFGDSYAFGGWYAVFLMSVLMYFSIYIFLKFTKPGVEYLTQLAMLSVLLSLCVFDNMFVYSSLSFQLLYPVFFTPLLRFLKFYPRGGGL